MCAAEQHQQFGNSNGRTNGVAGCIAAVIRGLAVSAEVFLHDAHTFGSRYLKRQAGMVLLLLFIQAVFWREHSLDGLVFFGLAFLFRWLYVLVRTSKRVSSGGVEPHSEYTGTPLLMRVFKRTSELRVKEGYEPLLVIAVAFCLIEWSPPLGFYLIYSAAGLGVSVTMCRVYQRERAIDLNDAYLEQRSIVEQFRDMRRD